MPTPRVFKLRQAEERPNNYTGPLPQIDKTRATAVLVRRSKRATALSEEQLNQLKDKGTLEMAYTESRETQLGLQDYAKLLYSSDNPNVRLYDEGDGVSGQKRIDQRKEMDRLYQDINKGIIGTIVAVREDRLFRNKHMDQVSIFTTLAEEKKIKLIVPPISSAASDEQTRVYDFTIPEHLSAFQKKMIEAYGYIAGHVKHANQCKQNKADKGGYDGRGLPPGLAVKGKKQNQIIVVYEPWAKEMKKIALRAQALDWDMGKLNREVANMAYLFPEIPDEDRERYTIKTTMHHIPGVGYKPRGSETIREWFKNVMYIGWFQPDEDKPDTIENHHDAILDRALFAEGYAYLTGYTLEGEPFDHPRGIKHIRKTRDVPPDALFHGKLITTPLSADKKTHVYTEDTEGIPYYKGYSTQINGLLVDRIFSFQSKPFDAIVIKRLKALVETDKKIAEKVKTTLEEVHNQQGEDFASIHDQLAGIEIQLTLLRGKSDSIGEEILKEKHNLKKANLKTSRKLEMWERKLAESEKQEEELLATKEDLEHKKEKLRIIDSPEEIARVHRLLGNFDKVWSTLDILQKQRAFSLIMNRIEVEVVSPHWLRLSIDWLDAICPRIDLAYLWRATPSHPAPFSKQEHEIIKQHYPSSPRLEILKLLPDRTWYAINRAANSKGIERLRRTHDGLIQTICYRDFMPNLDGRYLFGDYETTLNYLKMVSNNADKSKAHLCAVWMLSAQIADLIKLVDGGLDGLVKARNTANNGDCWPLSSSIFTF